MEKQTDLQRKHSRKKTRENAFWRKECDCIGISFDEDLPRNLVTGNDGGDAEFAPGEKSIAGK